MNVFDNVLSESQTQNWREINQQVANIMQNLINNLHFSRKVVVS